MRPVLPTGDSLRDAAVQVLLLALCTERTPLQVAVELEQQLFEDFKEPGGCFSLLCRLSADLGAGGQSPRACLACRSRGSAVRELMPAAAAPPAALLQTALWQGGTCALCTACTNICLLR